MTLYLFRHSIESSGSHPKLTFYLYNENGNLIQENLTMQDIQHFLLENTQKQQQQQQQQQQQPDEEEEPQMSRRAEKDHIKTMYETMILHMNGKLPTSPPPPTTTTTTTTTITTTTSVVNKPPKPVNSATFLINAEIHNVLNRVQGIMVKAHHQHQNETISQNKKPETTTSTTTTSKTFVKVKRPVPVQSGGITDLINNVLSKTKPESTISRS